MLVPLRRNSIKSVTRIHHLNTEPGKDSRVCDSNAV
jgi:hypothetical protein